MHRIFAPLRILSGICAFTLCLWCTPTASYAQIEDVTVGPNSTCGQCNFNMGEDLDPTTPPASPSITVIDGGRAGLIRLHNGSTANVTGGHVDDIVSIDSSSVNVSGGLVGYIFADGASASVSGGRVANLSVASGASGSIGGGSVGGASVGGDSNGGGTLSISGGQITNGIAAGGDGVLTMTGVPGGGGIYGFRNGRITLAGVTGFNYVQALETSVLNISNSTFLVHPNVLPVWEMRDDTTGVLSNVVFPGTMTITSHSAVSITDSQISGRIFSSSSNQLTIVGSTLGSELVVENGSLSLGQSTAGIVSLTNASATISSTNIGQSVIASDSNLNLNGSHVAGGLAAFFGSRVAMTGGSAGDATFGGVRSFDTFVNISGSELLNLQSSAHSNVTATGATIHGNVQSTGDTDQTGSIWLANSIVEGNVTVRDRGTMLIDGNSRVGGNLSVNNEGALANLQNTTVNGNVSATNGAIVNYFGGTIDGNVDVSNLGSYQAHAPTKINGNVTSDHGYLVVNGDVGGNIFVTGGSIGIRAGRVGQSVTVASTGFSLQQFGGQIEIMGDVTHVDGSFELVSGTIIRNFSAAGTGVPIREDDEDDGAGSGAEVTTIDGIVRGVVIGGNMDIRDTRSVDFRSGQVGGNLTLSGSAALTFRGGQVGGILRKNAAGLTEILNGTIEGGIETNIGSIDFKGGSVTGDTKLSNQAIIDQLGGSLGRVVLDNNSTFNLRFGTADRVGVGTDSTFNFSLGSVTHNVTLSTHGKMVMSNGVVHGNILGSGQDPDLVFPPIAESVLMTGGLVEGGIAVNNSTQATLLGGLINEGVSAYQNCQLEIGNLAGGPVIYGNVTATFSTAFFNKGSIIGNLVADESGAVTIISGTLEGKLAATGLMSKANVVGGQITHGLELRQNGQIEVSGGTITGDVQAYDVATLTLSNGTINGDVFLNNSSLANISGGTINGNLLNGLTVSITGGTIRDAWITTGASASSVTAGTVGNVITHNLSNVRIAGSSLVRRTIEAKENSTILVEGGTVEGAGTAEGSATVRLVGGQIKSDLSASGQAKVTVEGGTLTGNLGTRGDSFALLLGGTVKGSMFVNGNGNGTIGGGRLEHFALVVDSGKLNILGGEIVESVSVHDDGRVFMSAGKIDGDLTATTNSNVQILGGSVGSVVARDNATVYVRGIRIAPSGSGSGAATTNTGSELATGAELDPPIKISAYDNAKINIMGSDFTSALIDPNFEGAFSVYQLSGLLADGTAISGATVYLQNATSASFQIRTPGDYNLNGRVEANDYNAWKAAYGQTGDNLTADGNFDGTVDAADYTVWRNHLGQSAMLGTGSGAAIPEPSTALLMLAAIALLPIRTRFKFDSSAA